MKLFAEEWEGQQFIAAANGGKRNAALAAEGK